MHNDSISCTILSSVASDAWAETGSCELSVWASEPIEGKRGLLSDTNIVEDVYYDKFLSYHDH